MFEITRIEAASVTIIASYEDDVVAAQAPNGGVAIFDASEVDLDGTLMMISSGWTKSTELDAAALADKLMAGPAGPVTMKIM